MPQMGQEPGLGRRISGCIGQVYSVAAADDLGAGGGVAVGALAPEGANGWPRRSESMCLPGSALNFCRHPVLQK
jgi:hypothetical protein